MGKVDPFLLLKRPKRAVAPAATGLNKQSAVAGNHGFTKDLLREHFEYLPKGYFKRIKAYQNSRIGDVVRGALNRDGYRVICFRGYRTTFSRAVYIWHYGSISGEIDHIDGNRSNNRIENLREVSASQNCQSRHTKTWAVSGVKGLYWIERDRLWAGMVCANGVKKKVMAKDKRVAEQKLIELRNQMHGEYSSHSTRAHAKFSASGAERYFECPGSVAISEGIPDKSSPAALEGTQCHEVLERILRGRSFSDLPYTSVMITHANQAAKFIQKSLSSAGSDAELLIETRTSLSFLHPEAFGTLDAAVVDHFGLLNVIDFKYGMYSVSPRENLQLLFYALGVAHAHHWNFKRVRLTIIQPRVRGYDGPLFWEIPISELMNRRKVFKRAFDRSDNEPNTYVEGKWCFFCKAKKICPKKLEAKLEQAQSVFRAFPLSKKRTE